LKKLDVSPVLDICLVEKVLNELIETGTEEEEWNFGDFDESQVEEIAAKHCGGTCNLVTTIDRSRPVYTQDGVWTAYLKDWIFKLTDERYLLISYEETPSYEGIVLESRRFSAKWVTKDECRKYVKDYYESLLEEKRRETAHIEAELREALGELT